MAYPMFSQPSVPTVVVFDVGIITPSALLLQTNQSFQLAEDKTPYVYTYADASRFFTFAFSGVSQEVYDDFLVFLAHPLVNYQQYPFTYTDHLAVEYTVQLAAGDIQFQAYGTGLYSFTLPLLLRG